jgi:glutamate dehydrogenase (NAD(P)+)
MSLIKDTYQTLYGHRDINATGVTTGKAVSQMGIRGRSESTGLGVFYATRQIINDKKMLEKLGISGGIAGKRIIIQGFGNVGSWAAKFFADAGAIIVGVA